MTHQSSARRRSARRYGKQLSIERWRNWPLRGGSSKRSRTSNEFSLGTTGSDEYWFGGSGASATSGSWSRSISEGPSPLAACNELSPGRGVRRGNLQQGG